MSQTLFGDKNNIVNQSESSVLLISSSITDISMTLLLIRLQFNHW